SGLEKSFNVIKKIISIAKGYKTVSEDRKRAIGLAFGCGLTAEGELYIDFKTLLVVNKYCSDTGKTVNDIASEMDTPDKFAAWLKAPSDPNDEDSLSNLGLLTDIKTEIYAEYGMVD
ncbi:MAG: hypothetical protein ACK5HR_03340, partial [Mycoplasmatales bacterium]